MPFYAEPIGIESCGMYYEIKYGSSSCDVEDKIMLRVGSNLFPMVVSHSQNGVIDVFTKVKFERDNTSQSLEYKGEKVSIRSRSANNAVGIGDYLSDEYLARELLRTECNLIVFSEGNFKDAYEKALRGFINEVNRRYLKEVQTQKDRIDQKIRERQRIKEETDYMKRKYGF